MKTKSKILVSILSVVSSLSFAGNLNQLRSHITFCEEPVPIHIKKVANSLHDALVYTSTEPLYKITPKVQRYFRIIRPIFEEQQIPSDLMYLCIAESSLSSSATSYKGARGFWQFMPETAISLGLVVNDETDERLNLIKSTKAACTYFRSLYQQLGSWTLVAAAYNVGPTKVKQQISLRRNKNYYDWNINKENKAYLYRVMAIKEMLTRPQAYQAMFSDSIDLQTHLLRDGIVLGLVSSPIQVLQKVAQIVPTFLSSNELIISGFQNIISTTFKKTSSILYSRLDSIKRQLATISAFTNTTLNEGDCHFFNSNTSVFYRREDLYFIRLEKEFVYQTDQKRKRLRLFV